jgi:soluble lytic murein transglycosylase-like protein
VLTAEAMRADRDPRRDQALEAPAPEWRLQVRPKSDDELGGMLRGIEALIKLKEDGAAAVVLKRLPSRVNEAPLGLRLYVGALAARVSTTIPNTAPAFRALEPLITEHREYLHRPVLEALYPRPAAYFDDLLAARGALDPGVFAGMVHQESSMYPRARSSVAFGLTQMRPDTADEVNARLRLSNAPKLDGPDLFEPTLSLGLGAHYLEKMVAKFKDIRLGLAAYHSGDDRLRKWLAASPKINDPLILSHVLYLNAAGHTSTAVYVINVLSRADWYRSLYGEDLTGN